MGRSKTRFRRALIVALVLVIATLQVRGKSDREHDPPPLAPPDKPYGAGQVAYDVRYLLRKPMRLDRSERRWLYAVGGATLLLYALRDEIRDAVQRNRSEGRTDVYDAARTMGKGAFAPTLALIHLGASAITKQERERETALMLVESAAYSSVTALGGSFVLAAERPEEGDSITMFDPDGHGVSLDVALAASVVPPLRCQYLRVRAGDRRGRRVAKRIATGVLYGGAALTAMQRMDQDKHWAPDVFLGMMAGLGVGGSICEAHAEARRGRAVPRLTVTPGGAALSWSLR